MRIPLEISDEEFEVLTERIVESIIDNPPLLAKLQAKLQDPNLGKPTLPVELPGKGDTQSWVEIDSWYRKNWGLSTRVINPLGRARFYPKDVALMTESEILDIRNMGKKGLDEIRQAFKRNNIKHNLDG